MTEQRSRQTRSVLSPTGCERRYWQRVERRTVAGYERDLLEHVRGLALDAPVVTLAVRPGDGPLGELHLTVDDRVLVFQDVSMAALPAAESARFAGVGRYGRCWWVGLDTADGHRSILAANLVLLPFGPSGPIEPSARRGHTHAHRRRSDPVVHRPYRER